MIVNRQSSLPADIVRPMGERRPSSATHLLTRSIIEPPNGNHPFEPAVIRRASSHRRHRLCPAAISTILPGPMTRPINTPSDFAFRDDRGRPVPLRRSEMVANISGSPAGEGEWLLGVIINAMPIVLPAAAFAYFYLFQRWPAQVTFGPVFGALLVGAIVRAIVLRMTRPLAGVRLSLPSVLAYGHCGACGYQVANTPCSADGFHTCPECGAEWHHDRMVFAGHTPTETLGALRKASSLSRQSDTGWVDDRGVALSTPYRWPRGIFRSVTPPHAAGARAELSRRLGRAALIFISVVWVLAGLLSMVFIPSPTLRLGEKIWSCLILIMVAAVIHALARMARLQPVDVRSAVLGHGLCPSCWGAINQADSNANERLEFDGCVTCRACRAAWLGGDVHRGV